jgi:hypothetical protein
MSQGANQIPAVPPLSGASLVGDANGALAALLTQYSGTSAPSGPSVAQLWLDTSASPIDVLKQWDGAQWCPLAVLDATNHQVYAPVGGGTGTLASAATTDLSSVRGAEVTVTGNTGITSFGSPSLPHLTGPGCVKFVTFTGTLTITNGANLICPGSTNINVVPGTTLIAIYEGASVWRVWFVLGTGGGSVISVATDGSMYGGTITTSGTLGVQVPVEPGGRVTLQTGTPVMTTTQSAVTTVFYTLYKHPFVPIYDGTRFVLTNTGGELSQATTDATKSPAAVTTNSNYDVFVWNDTGTIRATRGPAWSSNTARGAGAGTTELQRINGVWTNANNITNGPNANRGTYVGTVRSNGSSQIDWIFGAIGAPPTAASFGVWNMYNRVTIGTLLGDSTGSWTYSTNTYRQPRADTTFQCSFVCGLVEDAVSATYQIAGANTTSNIYVSIGVDNTTPLGTTGDIGGSTTGPAHSDYVGYPGLGWHTIQPLEAAFGATGTFRGGTDGSPAGSNVNAFTVQLRG